MKALLAAAFAILLAIAGLAYYLVHRPVERDIATYIDGTWLPGEYRGCMLVPPDRKNLYCGVNPEHKGLPWAEVLSDREHTHVIPVSFSGTADAVFWRCQKMSTTVTCRDAGIRTEIVP